MKTNKKILTLLLAFALVFSLVACNKGGEKSPETQPSEAKSDIEIAGVVFQDDEFMNMLTKGMVDAANEEGISIKTANTQSDQSREVELINTYIAEGLKGICIAPLDPVTSIATLKTAAEAGLEVTTVNLQLEPGSADFIAGGYSSDDFSNGKQIGEVAADYIKANYDRPVKLGILDFDHQVPAQSTNRYGGFLEALDDAGIEYEIVGQQSAEKEDTALVAAQGIIAANPDIDIIYGANSGGLIGAVNAIKQSSNADTVKAFGYDGNDVITTLLMDDTDILQGVVVQDPYTQGYEAVKLLVATIKGEDSKLAGKTEAVPGMILKRGDDDAIAQYRKDNGFD